jgi:FKBP-type peptidyl-prolyl cis-trans isomerase
MMVEMTMNSRVFLAFSLGLALLAGGCGEPPASTPMTAPGVDQRSLLLEKKKAKDEPEALGEQAVAGTKTAGAGATTKAAGKEAIPDLEPAPPTAKDETKTTKSGVKYTTVKEGTGAIVKAGQRVTVHYVGKLDDGREFDNSRKRDVPAQFSIGTGDVIRGWDESVPGMKIGEIRKLDIPAASGYGAQGKPPVIPPNAELHFEIEVINAN